MRASVLLALSLFLLAPTAHAERKLFGRTVPEVPAPSAEEYARRRAAFHEHLRADDLELQGDHLAPRLDLQGEPRPQHGGEWEDPPHYATIFLNFFGGELTSGTNAAEMEAGCVGATPIMYPGFGGTEQFALTIIQVFQAAMEPYAVRIAFEEPPPAHLPYSQVMMGGTPADIGLDPGTLGVSCSSDCGDVWWRDTTFAFTEESSSALTLGNTALQEAAHAFGLDHIDGSEHIMYPFADSGQKIWANACTPYNDATGGISCTFVHDAFCGADAGMQNDDAELLAFFGPNEPDVTAPTVSITEPADAAEFPAPADVSVAVDVADDHEGFGWRLVIEPEGADPVIENAYQFETSWNLADLPQGVYHIRVEAIDHDRNEGMDAVTIYVGEAPPETTGADSTGDEGPGTSDTADTNDEDDEDTNDEAGTDDSGPSADDGDTKTSCSCTSEPIAPTFATAVLGLAFIVRRRRPSAAT